MGGWGVGIDIGMGRVVETCLEVCQHVFFILLEFLGFLGFFRHVGVSPLLKV